MTRRILTVLVLGIALTVAGCGSGTFDRLGDIPDHCKIGPAQQGWIDLNLTCVSAEPVHNTDSTAFVADDTQWQVGHLT